VTLTKKAALAIRLIVLDVDGVMTDGGLYLGADAAGTPIELKRFDIKDQLGVKMLAWSGLEVTMVSGRASTASRLRAEELGITCHEGAGGYKLAIVDRLHAELGIGWKETACICDDLADLPILRRAGLAVAVADAAPEVRATAHWTTGRPGGHGAVREFSEQLLRARGEWNDLVVKYVKDREEAAHA
jgi:3-deoxy-D-manno-octulosonate 8-phosphate phosphatase (KDO 8-P phosphatase)